MSKRSANEAFSDECFGRSVRQKTEVQVKLESSEGKIELSGGCGIKTEAMESALKASSAMKQEPHNALESGLGGSVAAYSRECVDKARDLSRRQLSAMESTVLHFDKENAALKERNGELASKVKALERDKNALFHKNRKLYQQRNGETRRYHEMERRWREEFARLRGDVQRKQKEIDELVQKIAVCRKWLKDEEWAGLKISRLLAREQDVSSALKEHLKRKELDVEDLMRERTGLIVDAGLERAMGDGYRLELSATRFRLEQSQAGAQAMAAQLAQAHAEIAILEKETGSASERDQTDRVSGQC
ncbi:hypothetical protein V5O48_007235 [Marasmius crinis-equi]|uniref:Uncharacterized protein n=1 Tax=Marasmius crinis-equi TaxID=585013 RepID=A0ABR3FH93_9AGAR